MKSLKKFFALCLTLALVLSLAACAQKPAETTDPAETPDTPAQETEAPVTARIAALKGPTAMGLVKLMSDAPSSANGPLYDFTLAGSADEVTPALIKGELDITVPVSRAYTGSGKISARPEQLFFSESGMPGTILFSTFLGDFIEYEVQLNDGQNLIVNEYTKDTTEIHSDGEQVHLSFDPMRISLYDKSEEVLSL